MIMYLSVMSRALSARVRAMGVLTDGRHAALYVASKGLDGIFSFAKSSPLTMNSGDHAASNRDHGACV